MSTHYQSTHYASTHYLSTHYSRITFVPPPDEVINPPGSDPAMEALRDRILREDEEIFALIVSFMNTKDG